MPTGSIQHLIDLIDADGRSLLPDEIVRAFSRTYTKFSIIPLPVTGLLVTHNIQTFVPGTTNGLLLVNPHATAGIDYAFAGVSSLAVPAGQFAFHPAANITGGGISIISTAGATLFYVVVLVP